MLGGRGEGGKGAAVRGEGGGRGVRVQLLGGGGRGVRVQL